MYNFRTIVEDAAAEGKFGFEHTDDSEGDFESIQEWIEYASDFDIEQAAYDAGLVEDQRGDIHEINEEHQRRQAHYAGIIYNSKYED